MTLLRQDAASLRDFLPSGFGSTILTKIGAPQLGAVGSQPKGSVMLATHSRALATVYKTVVPYGGDEGAEARLLITASQSDVWRFGWDGAAPSVPTSLRHR